MRTRLGLACILSIVVGLLSSSLFQVPALGGMENQATPAPDQDLSWESRTPIPSLDAIPRQSIFGPAQRRGPDGWVAGQTSVSKFTQDQQGGLCGVPLEVIEWEQVQAREQRSGLSATGSYPPTLDWRDFEGQDWTTPIRDQAGCGACAAFATVAAIESRLEIAMQDPNLNPDLSEADLFYCGCGSCCSTGWSPTAAMDRAREEGIVDEACYPYTADNQACLPCGDLENRVTKISNWVGITDPSAMKQALADGGPFEATMLVYADFLSYSGGVYRHTWGDLIGGHGVTIVGYDDYQGYWIAKNNWGTDWGENGWFKIAYGECVIASYAYVPVIGEPSYHVSTTTSPSGSGTVVSSPPACSIATCEPGSLVELAAMADPGYMFSGWSGDVSGLENPVVVVLDSDKFVTAHFDLACGDCRRQIFLPLVWKQ